jgi:hypothetical protein
MDGTGLALINMLSTGTVAHPRLGLAHWGLTLWAWTSLDIEATAAHHNLETHVDLVFVVLTSVAQ